jgi:hypothetical protein
MCSDLRVLTPLSLSAESSFYSSPAYRSGKVVRVLAVRNTPVLADGPNGSRCVADNRMMHSKGDTIPREKEFCLVSGE